MMYTASIALLFDISGGEFLVILLFILIFFGSKNIPDLARGLGRGYRQIKDAADSIKTEIKKGSGDLTDSIGRPLDQHFNDIDNELKKDMGKVQKDIDDELNKS